MPLPKWKPEWDHPDPLRGRQGWFLHHYVSLLIAIILIGSPIVFLFPVIARTRKHDADLKRMRKDVRDAVVEDSSKP
jgi:hypothetical protein